MPQANAKARTLDHDKIRMDQQKSRQVVSFLGHNNINQVKMFTISHTKMMLLEYNHIYQVFTSAPD